jgi:hypothetical protein
LGAGRQPPGSDGFPERPFEGRPPAESRLEIEVQLVAATGP